MKFISMALLAGAAFLTGCASTPGYFEAKTAPKIIVKDGKNVWDNVAYFGQVPLRLAGKGEQTCATMNTDKAKYIAKGYHSKALNMDGVPFPGGGYYCVIK